MLKDFFSNKVGIKILAVALALILWGIARYWGL
jgi:hypothetical protein